MEYTELYKAFRSELDDIWIPEYLNRAVSIIPIKNKLENVGFMTVIEESGLINVKCIDGLYVMSEYRRKHLAKDAVLDWYRKQNNNIITLYIVRNNIPAKKFWNSLFVLEKTAESSTDDMYRIVCEKERKNDNGKQSKRQ